MSGQSDQMESTSTTYVRVRWEHDNDDDPIVRYYELDSGRMTRGVVEAFGDGRVQRADTVDPDAPTSLSWEPIPTRDEIHQQPEFTGRAITIAEFEAVWRRGSASA